MKKAIVMGTGPSLHSLLARRPELGRVTTWGVNDIARYVPDCEHIVIFDDPDRMGHRMQWVLGAHPTTYWVRAVDTWRRELGDERPIRRMRSDKSFQHFDVESFAYLREQGVEVPEVPIWQTTPSGAVGLAWYMGHDDVAIVGVDIRGHPDLDRAHTPGEINEFFGKLRACIEHHGGTLVNLAQRHQTAVQSLDFVTWEEWIDGHPEHESRAG